MPTKRPRGRPKEHATPRHTLPLRLDEVFYQQLRRYAVEHDRTVTQIAIEALETWWKTRPDGGPV